MKARILFAALALSASTMLAAGNPDPNLSKLDYFGGKWTCAGTDMSSGKSMASASMASSRWDYGNKWLVVDLNMTKPAAGKAIAYLGYDEGEKMFALGYLDSMGSYGTSWSKGWMGDSITYDGEVHMMGMTGMKQRDVFQKMGATKFKHTFSVEEKGGAWKQMMEETCWK